MRSLLVAVVAAITAIACSAIAEENSPRTVAPVPNIQIMEEISAALAPLPTGPGGLQDPQDMATAIKGIPGVAAVQVQPDGSVTAQMNNGAEFALINNRPAPPPPPVK